MRIEQRPCRGSASTHTCIYNYLEDFNLIEIQFLLLIVVAVAGASLVLCYSLSQDAPVSCLLSEFARFVLLVEGRLSCSPLWTLSMALKYAKLVTEFTSVVLAGPFG